MRSVKSDKTARLLRKLALATRKRQLYPEEASILDSKNFITPIGINRPFGLLQVHGEKVP